MVQEGAAAAAAHIQNLGDPGEEVVAARIQSPGALVVVGEEGEGKPC